MWSKTSSLKVKGLTAEQVWKVWTDVDRWHEWQGDIEHAKMNGPFKTGASFLFKPKGGPKINIELTEVSPNKTFVDVTRFPLAQMYDSHEIIRHGDELELKVTTSIQGPLSFLWRKFVAENVAAGQGEQMEGLVKRVRYGAD